MSNVKTKRLNEAIKKSLNKKTFTKKETEQEREKRQSLNIELEQEHKKGRENN